MDARISQISLRSAALSVADLVLPRVCVVCGRTLLPRETHVCTACAADLPRTFFAGQRDNPMALAFNALVERELGGSHGVDTPSGACSLPTTQPFSYAAALFYYRGDSPYSLIPQALKYDRNFGAGRYFARMLGRELAASSLFADVDAILPVPLHWLRQWRRGYNQAEVIAKGIAEELKGGAEASGSPAPPVLTRVLKRVRRTRTQTRLDAGGRYANVHSAFVADGKVLGKPLHLLLVDDVFTTGATLLACERALRRALTETLGPEAASRVRISVATLAYVGR
ncbi:MAG: ComF family protein [Bacteroidales bacterium]|nr:ComF family protein [Bacteroidales bacterium]MBQ4480905.1 ComF family protein [Victivallales bacterium]